MNKILNEFKSFALKGNVVDLAVGIIIGTAFGKIVSSLVSDVIMPFFGFVTGRINLAGLSATLAPEKDLTPELVLKYGAFLQSVVDFLIISFSIFLIVKLFNAFRMRTEKPSAPPETTKQEKLLEEIRDLLKKQSE